MNDQLSDDQPADDQPADHKLSGHDPRPVDRSTESLRLLGDRRSELAERRHDPRQFREWLAVSDNAEEVARADIVPHLRAWFTPTDGWKASEYGGPLGPDGAGVEWQWQGIHDRDHVFNGLLATGADVVVRGYSVMSLDPKGAVKVRRYIDWAGLFTQLGLTLNWRLPVRSEPETDR
jgi:hypothetical protein